MAKTAKKQAASAPKPRSGGFAALERNILKAKGLSEAQIDGLVAAGVSSRRDFHTVGDAVTLAELAGIPLEAAGRVMAWALGAATSAGATTAGGGAGTVVVETADVVYCVHCRTKQPKDYKNGDLCIACGKQAEPSFACFWCSASGPGKYCRNCGAEFVPTGELELAVHLKREGVAKDEVVPKLRAMSAAEKEALWGRVRRGR